MLHDAAAGGVSATFVLFCLQMRAEKSTRPSCNKFLADVGVTPRKRCITIFAKEVMCIWRSKRAKNTCWRIPNGPRSVLENCVFDPFLPIFGSKKAHFQGILRFSMGQKKCVTTSSKRAENTYLSIPNDTTSLLERHVF